jgi:hypothetical protein
MLNLLFIGILTLGTICAKYLLAFYEQKIVNLHVSFYFDIGFNISTKRLEILCLINNLSLYLKVLLTTIPDILLP